MILIVGTRKSKGARGDISPVPRMLEVARDATAPPCLAWQKEGRVPTGSSEGEAREAERGRRSRPLRAPCNARRACASPRRVGWGGVGARPASAHAPGRGGGVWRNGRSRPRARGGGGRTEQVERRRLPSAHERRAAQPHHPSSPNR